MRHSKDEIIKLLQLLDKQPANELESETLDFKEWISNPRELYKKLVEYAVCFANQKGGTLILGVKDNIKGREKAITGCAGYNISEIKARIYEATDPKILVDIEEVFLNDLGVTILLIHIPSGIGLHTTTDGTAKIRIGKDCKPLTGTMRHQKLIEMGIFDYSAQIKDNLSIDAFDRIEIERLRNIIKSKYPDSSLLKLDKREFLEQLGITRKGFPTIGGLILIGKKEIIREIIPSNEVVYLHLKNDIDYDLRKDYSEGILFILDDLQNTIETYNKIFTLKVGLFHYEIKDFPVETYREAILNALLHRDYSKREAVFIKHYAYRMEISNPGGFISGITVDNILRQDSKPRNPHLADILRKIGLIEKAGMGIKRIFYTQLASGKDLPFYQTDGQSVRLIIKNGTIDETFVKFIKEKQNNGEDIGLDELLILSALRHQKEISIIEASKVLQLGVNRTREILNQFVSRGLLEKSGIKKGMVYRLSGQVYKKLAESIPYIRHKGIDEIRYPELILSFVEKYGKITNQQVRELLGVNRDKAKRILIQLEKQNKLVKKGVYKTTYYVLKK